MLIRPQNLGSSLHAVRDRITSAAVQHGRNADSVTLLAVGKGHPVSVLAEAAALGVRDFGENYLQEALPKISALGEEGLTWHFIGQIQTNKTRDIATRFDWVHTIDRVRIAQRLAEQRPPRVAPLQVCIQVRLDAEPQRGGVAPADAATLVATIRGLPQLQLRGLMCVPPAADDLPTQRRAFATVRALRDRLCQDFPGLTLDTLSMGMSDDLEAAIAEGATIVRIGTALFGPRQRG